MEYWQIFWYWGDPQDLRVMEYYSDPRSDHYLELYKFSNFNSIFVDVDVVQCDENVSNSCLTCLMMSVTAV